MRKPVLNVLTVSTVALTILAGSAVISSPAPAATKAVAKPSTKTANNVPTQKVNVTMTDIKYSVKSIKVKKGVPVTFTFVNKGKAVHEAVIGTRSHQLAHDKEMAAMGSMTMSDEPTAISLKPGVTKTLTYTFTKAGSFEVGCHTPGHYNAGMKIDVAVS